MMACVYRNYCDRVTDARNTQKVITIDVKNSEWIKKDEQIKGSERNRLLRDENLQLECCMSLEKFISLEILSINCSKEHPLFPFHLLSDIRKHNYATQERE